MLPSYIINSEALLHRSMGDHQVARETLGCFRDSIPGLIETLHDHVSESDHVAAFATVTNILRMAICSCAVTVQECALQMGHAVMMEDTASVREIIPLLERMSDEAIGAINAHYSLFSSSLVDVG